MSQNAWSTGVPVEESSYYWKGVPQVTPGTPLASGIPLVVELFAGCGGTSLGFEMAGYQIAVGCDIHRYSIQTFKRNHPAATTILGDMRQVTPDLIRAQLGERKVDVLIAGVPCQGFSLNNRKRHAGDTRNQLYKLFVEHVSQLQPRVIVMENVSGMRSMGDYMHAIEHDLSAAGNMVVRSQLLYAPDYGVPQTRRRLVFIGIRGEVFDFSTIKKTHGPTTTLPYLTVRDAIGDLPRLQPNQAATAYTTPPQTAYQRLMRGTVGDENLTCHQAPNHPQDTIDRIASTPPGEPLYAKFRQRIRLTWNQPSPTQVAGGIRPQFQFAHPTDNRGLTIRERCRIQSFPDQFEVVGGLVQGRVQTGNAVPPLLARAIALSIKSYL